jgi:acetyl esterase/lipase
MNLLLRLIIRIVDKKCSAFEAKSETDHQVPDGVEEYLDIPFQGAGACPLAVDIFRTKDRGLRPLPVVIMVHGGGLVVGTRKLSRTFCENLAAKGFLVFAPEYRRVPDVDALAEIGDIFSGFSFISKVLAEYGGDPDRVAVASESAGSFLSVYAMAAAVSPVLRDLFMLPPAPPLHFRAMACFSGMYYTSRKDIVGFFYAKNIYGERKKDWSFMQFMNPENPEVIKCLPPALLVGSDADFLKNYTAYFSSALKREAHPCELIYYTDNKTLTHAFPALKPDLPESKAIVEKLAKWFLTV